MASVQDAQVPATLKETETTNKEVTTKIDETIPDKSGIEVPAPEAASTEQPKEETKEASVPVTVETKEVVIEKTEEKAREVIIEDPTAPAEDEKQNEESETAEAAEEVTTVEKTEA